MKLSECTQLLNDTIVSNLSTQNVSFLSHSARGKKEKECIDNFGGIVAVSNYIKTIDIDRLLENTPSHGAASTTTEKQEPQQTILWEWGTFLKDIWTLVFLLILWFLLYKVIRYLLMFVYDVLNAHRMVYLRVLQTRGDSKIDREIEKEIAKDMKEKISRMSQVYNNLYRLGKSSVFQSILTKIFNKPKLTLTISYERWNVEFIIGVYPEYKSIVEWAISAQFSDSSIETMKEPEYLKKRYTDISILEPQKDTAYTIRNFNYMPDDPLNNLVDSVAKVDQNDTFHILMIVKPQSKSYNKRVKKIADTLFKGKSTKRFMTPRWHYLLMPWKVLKFFITWPSKDMLKGKNDSTGLVRMVKAEEDAYQSMAEEAANHSFQAAIVLLTSSDKSTNVRKNLENVTSAYSIYTNQYLNGIKQSNWKEDMFWWFFKPMRRFAIRFKLLPFFFTKNVFSVNALSSLFHFPDGTYNRSQVIRRLDYKTLWAPSNAPVLSPAQDNGYIMSGIVSETYLSGDLDKILRKHPHPMMGSRIKKEEQLIPIEHYKEDDLADKEIIEKDDKRYVKLVTEKEVYGYKINRDGILLGVNVHRNKFTPIYMKREDRMRHHYIIWKSGTGKSVALHTYARQDIRNWDGVCVIDPHGDLIDDVLSYVPKERAKDVIVFDAWNKDRPMWLNLYDIANIDQADRTVNDATEIFLKMFGPEIFWPRIQEYFKYWSLTILEDFEDKPTLLDVPRLFTDETYRTYKTKRVQNAVVRSFWEKTYNAMWDREKQEIIPYFTSKFVSFNTNRLIRNIIGQTSTAIKFREAMDSQKIILISLSKWDIGEMNAQLLGMIMVSQIYNGAMARADTAAQDRKDFFLYVDEFQNFVSATFADILSEARKYRLALIMAHQYIAQLEAGKWLWQDSGWKWDVKAAVFGNVGTMQSFKIGAPDAEFMEKEYAPVLGAQDIIGIANYKTYCKLNIDNSTSRVFSMDAPYSLDYRNKKMIGLLKEYSAKKYGRREEFVNAEISTRLGISLSKDFEQSGDSLLEDSSWSSDQWTSWSDLLSWATNMLAAPATKPTKNKDSEQEIEETTA